MPTAYSSQVASPSGLDHDVVEEWPRKPRTSGVKSVSVDERKAADRQANIPRHYPLFHRSSNRCGRYIGLAVMAMKQ